MSYEQDDLIRSEPDEFHLACLLLAPSAVAYLGDTLADVDPTDFYDSTLTAIWGAARAIHGRGERVTRRSLMVEVGTPPPGQVKPLVPASLVKVWLDRVGGEAVYPEKIPGSVRSVVEAAKLRRLVIAADQIKRRALLAEDYAQAYGWAAEVLGELADDEVPDEVVPFANLVDAFHKQMAGGVVVGEVVPTPWPELNELLSGGFHPGRSYVVAGRPGGGKTTMGLNAAAGVAEQGFPTLVVSQEMSSFEVTGKVLAAGGHAEYGEIVRQSMSDDTAYRIAEYGDTNREMPLWVIDKPGLSIEYVAAVARSVKRKHGLSLLFVDYIQLIEPTSRRVVREQQVAHISRSIKLLANELGCAVVTAAQLNRENIKSNRRPTLADLRESGSVEQDADAVVLLHHERGEEDLPTGMVTLILAKNRFGRTGDVDLRWRGHQARMGD
ncbi:MAG: replicative DNA helicase [Candidatus Dormibacteria bacterium]